MPNLTHRTRRPCRPQVDRSPSDLSDLSHLVEAAARLAVRLLNDPALGREDVEQEFRVRLIQGLPAHDPEQMSREQFARMLLRRQRDSLLRERYAAKRSAGTVVSLQTPVCHEGAETTLAATVASDQTASGRGAPLRDEVERVDLRLDTTAALERAPAKGRAVAERLMADRNASVASRRTGIPRSTLNDQVRKLRKPFEQAGMKDYLK